MNLIHIHAKCEAFEFFEQVIESVAEKRLIEIRDGFMGLGNRPQYQNDKLVVKTQIVNPELQFY